MLNHEEEKKAAKGKLRAGEGTGRRESNKKGRKRLTMNIGAVARSCEEL
jgi:hypothetical protein